MSWFEIWYDDKQGMIETMARNIAADISAGYSYLGNCIQKQKQELDDYKAEFEEQLMSFADMEDGKRNRWCYYDLLRRGAITR